MPGSIKPIIDILPAFWNGDAIWGADSEPDDIQKRAFLISTDGSIYHHTNDNPDDVDWVRFSAQEGVGYTLALTNESVGNYYLQLYDSQEANISGAQSTGYSWSCPQTGIYYVKLWEQSDDQAGSFDFSITAGTADYAVGIAQKYVTLYLNPSFGVDSYQLVADCSNAPASIVWGSSDDSVVTVSAAGLLQAQGVGTATVTATCTAGGTSDTVLVTVYADDFEDDDVRAQAQPIDVGVVPHYGSFVPEGGVEDHFDWLKFEAVEGYGYVINLVQEAGAAIYYNLVNGNDEELLSNQSASKEWICPATGTYYLQLWSGSYLQWSGYRIRVLPAYWNGNAKWWSNFEPNNQAYTSCFVCTDNSSNYYSYVHAYSETGSDYDWYRFYAVQDASYNVVLTNELGGNYYFRLYDSNLNSISSDITSDLTWTCPVTGIYHVRILEQSSDQTGSYDFDILSIDGSPADIDSDGDQIDDCWELYYFGNGNIYRDGSGDYDNDGLTDKEEFDLGTDPTLLDTDQDGMPDIWENDNNLNPTLNDAVDDPDDDNLNNLGEYNWNTNPQNPDSDSDKMTDGWETINGMNPLFDDCLEDADLDGYCNLREFLSLSDPQNESDIPDIIADYEPDGDVDGVDLSFFLIQYQNSACLSTQCYYDFDRDNDVDFIDLFLFAEDYGRIN